MIPVLLIGLSLYWPFPNAHQRGSSSPQAQPSVPRGSAITSGPPSIDPLAPQTGTCVTAPSGLVSWWPLDGNANDIKDGNNGNVSGSGGQFVQGKVGQGFQSGGPGSLVQAKDAPNLNPPEFTIDAWVKINALTTSNPPIIWKGDNLGHDSTSSYGLGLFGNPGSLSFPPGSIITGTPAIGKAFFTINDAVTDQALVSSAPIAIGSFVHFAASANGTTMRLYVNGQLDTEANQVITPQHSTFPFQIGSANASSHPGFFLDGIIDEVSLYNLAIAPSEVQSIFNAGSAGKCSCSIRQPGLVSWWPGDGNANDIVGPNLGTLKGGVSFAPGIVGQAFNLSGIDGNIQIPNSPGLNPANAITVAAWYKPTVSFVGDGLNSIVDKGYVNHSPPYYQYHLSVSGDQYLAGPSHGFFEFDVSTPSGGSGGVATGTSFWRLGYWYYLVGTYDGSAVKLYVNGTLIQSYPLSGTMVDYGKNVSIGGFSNINRPNIDYTPGLVDEVQIYNRSLTASEIQSIFNAGSLGTCHCVTPPPGLASWWPGDGNANDIIGNRNGGLMNGASFGPGIVGPAFSFNGASQYANVTNSPGLQVSAGNFTVDAWVKFNALGGDMSILDKMANGGTNQDGWRLIKQADNHFWFCLGGGLANGCTGGFPTLVTSATTVSSGIWYHVAAVKTSVSLSIYVNGTLDGTTQLGPFTDTNSANLLIGATASQGATAFLNGFVDEAQLYNRALNASQIQSIFGAGSAGCCKTSTLPVLTADFSFPPATVSDPVSLTATASGGSPPYSFSWNTGAGATVPGNPVTFTYSAAASYLVSVTVTDSAGHTATASHTVNVQASFLTVDFSFPTPVTSGSPVTFTVAPFGCGGPTFAWAVGNSTLSASTSGLLDFSKFTLVSTGTSNALTYTFSTPGNYTVVLATTETCAEGTVTSYTSHFVTVGGAAPAPHSTTTSVSCDTPVVVDQASTCTATVTDTSATSPTAPSGTVTFSTSFFGSFDSSNCTLVGGAATSSACHVAFTPSASGSASINGAYAPTDTTHSGSSTTTSFGITVNLRMTSTSITCTPSSVVANQASTCTATVTDTSNSPTNPMGSAKFSFNGTPDVFACGLAAHGLNAATCSEGQLSRPVGTGSEPITASYSGDATHQSSVSSTFTLSVSKATPAVATTLSATAITVGGSVSDSATLTGGFTPTGPVSFSFYSGDCSSGIVTILLPPVSLVGSSATSISQSFNSAGSFSWKAVYLGDANNNPATSGCETLSVVEAAGFTILANPTSLTVAPGDSRTCEGQGSAQRCDDEGSSTITVTGSNGFTGTVTLTVLTSPNLTVSLNTATVTGSGSSTLTVSEGRPGNYTVTVTGTSGSITQSAVVSVMVRPPVPLKCGGNSDCKIESDAPLSDVTFGDKKIHFTVDGTAGARGAVNVTIPRSAVPDIDRIEVSVDGARLPRSALMIAADDSDYHVYFSFTFHSPVVVDIDLAPAVTILGLKPLAFYGIVGGGIAVVLMGGVLAVLRRRRAKVQN